MADEMYVKHKDDMLSFIQNLTHWYRLGKFGLEKDLEYCVTEDVANVLPIFKNGDLILG